MIRILIADDYAVVRQGLKQILENGSQMRVVADAANGVEALAKIRKIPCDIVLLDIAMEGMSGIDALKQIRAFNPKLPVLILSSYPEDQYAVRLLKAGAAGYLNKESAPGLIIEAVRLVVGGKKYISQAVAEMLANQLGDTNTLLPHETLSDRESQIFLMLASAKTVTDISVSMALSVKTISTYRSRILKKMQLRNNSELMQYAFNQRLTP